MIVGGVGAITLLRNRLKKCMLPRRISAGIKNEVKRKKINKKIEQVPLHHPTPSET